MLFANQKTVFNHDYFKIINSVYPKIRHNIDKIIQSFEESKDASKYFVAYFSEGHSEIHSILGDRISCNTINQLLADLFYLPSNLIAMHLIMKYLIYFIITTQYITLIKLRT